jgi:hypothetical protein
MAPTNGFSGRFFEVLLGLVWNSIHHKGPGAPEPQPKSKSDISHEGREEHEGRKYFFFDSIPILSGLRDLRGDEINATVPDSPHGNLKSLLRKSVRELV